MYLGMDRVALRVIVTGIVQGVGFRPFIHRVAVKSSVNGYVRNVGGSEVEIFIEGHPDSISRFFKLMMKEKPSICTIDEIEVIEEVPRGLSGFRIVSSLDKSIKRSMIPPDIAICDECLREVLDPSDRRFRYAFNSCAWCGPRFSMMYKVPYDRCNTSMRKYRLCSDCLREYNDINNVRRYHAQGISCPRDGPKLKLLSIDGSEITCRDPIEEAAKLIDEGYIVAVKGIGGFHLAVLASDDDVVLKLRKRKKRPQKPFAVMVLDLRVANKLVHLNDKAIEVLRSPQRPIVLLPKREDTPVSRYVSPGLKVEGIFLPYTALHYLILMSCRDKFLIMTSGNPPGKPMCVDDECVFKHLRGVVDYVLTHDREIVNRVDDSVVRFTDGELVILRRSRGYAPVWIKINRKLPHEVVAFGAELNVTGAVGFDDKVVLTQYIGDVEDLDNLNDLDKYLTFLIRNYGIDLSRAILVIDKHPNYLTRELALNYARRYGCKVIEVQHHYAHILSVLADRSLIGKSRIVGVAIDGVGYGDDGNIWGGEVLVINEDLSYERIGHLKYQPLIGDIATKYPTMFLESILLQFLNENEVIKILGNNYRKEVVIVSRLLSSRKYVWTSSTGRVLDAISALLNICRFRSYEGEPAIKLEEAARSGKLISDYEVPIRTIGNELIIDTTSLFEEILNMLDHKVEDIALSTQVILGKALGRLVVNYLRGRRGYLDYIVLSGGASVNDFIVRGIKSVLSEEGFKVLLPKKVPPNDGGLSLGQVVATLSCPGA